MAITKTVKVQVDTGSSVQRLDEVKQGFDEIEESAQEGTTATVGMTGAIKLLGLALKSAGIGLAISALVGLSEALNLAFKKIVNPMVDVIEYSITQTDLLQLQWEKYTQLANIVKTALTASIKGYIKVFNMAQLAWEESFLGDGDPETIERLKGNIEGINEEARNLKDNLRDQALGYIETEKEIAKIQEENTQRLIKAFSDIAPDGIIETSKAIVQLRNDVKLAEADQRIAQLESQKRAEVQRQIRDDVSRSIEDRIEANERLGKILEEQLDEEMVAANMRLKLARLELSTDQENVDLKVAEKNAIAELADLQERITSQESEQKTNINSLLKEQMDLEDKLADKKSKAADQAIKDAEAEKMARINAGKAILTATTKLVGEGTKVGKAAALTNILIDTALAISGAVKAAQTVGFPGNIAAIGVGIAAVMTNLASAKNILKKAGVDGGGGDDVGAVGSTPAMGGIGGTIPNISAITTPETDITPVQAFVVETDISDAQALQDELEIQATL
jgi:hypothetical protein